MEPNPTPGNGERRASLGCLAGILSGSAAAISGVLVIAPTNHPGWLAAVAGLLVVIPSGILGTLFGVTLGRFMTTADRAVRMGAAFGLLLWGVVRFSICYAFGLKVVTDYVWFPLFTITGRAAEVIAFLGVSFLVGGVFGFIYHLLQKRAENRAGRGGSSMDSPVCR